MPDLKLPDLKLPDTKPSRDSWLKLDDKTMDGQQEPEKESRSGKLFQLKIDPEFRKALDEAWQKDSRVRSLTHWILMVLADKIKWKGKI